MTAPSWISGVMLVAVLGLLLAEWRGFRPGVWLCKPLAASCFVALALAWGALETPYGVVLLAGLVLSWWGDVLLIPRGREAVFLAGVGAFGLGHVAYVVAFAVRGVAVVPAALTLAAGVAIAVPVWRWLAPHTGSLRPAVLGYVVVITAMIGLGVGAAVHSGDPWIAAGALAFYVSDLAVARDRFVTPSFTNGLWGLPLYFGGQWILASTVARALAG